MSLTGHVRLIEATLAGRGAGCVQVTDVPPGGVDDVVAKRERVAVGQHVWPLRSDLGFGRVIREAELIPVLLGETKRLLLEPFAAGTQAHGHHESRAPGHHRSCVHVLLR